MNDVDMALKEAAKQIISAKLVDALGGDILNRLVEDVMVHKDTRSYGVDRNQTFIDKVVNDTLQDMIRQEVGRYMRDNSELKASIAKAFAEHGEKMALAVVTAFATDAWNAALNITINAGD